LNNLGAPGVTGLGLENLGNLEHRLGAHLGGRTLDENLESLGETLKQGGALGIQGLGLENLAIP
jgi:hypothetical protein